LTPNKLVENTVNVEAFPVKDALSLLHGIQSELLSCCWRCIL